MSQDAICLIGKYRQGICSPADIKLLIDIIGEFPIYKHFNRNWLLDNDDIRQEYRFGIYIALDRVDLNKPNTVLPFIRKWGEYKVRVYVRKQFNKGLAGVCEKCNKLYSYPKKICKCGGEIKFSVMHVHNKLDRPDDYRFIEEDHSHKIQNKDYPKSFIDRFGEELRDKNKEIYYDLMNMEIVSADNYIEKLSEKHGISTTNVNLRIRKIRDAQRRYSRCVGEDMYGEHYWKEYFKNKGKK